MFTIDLLKGHGIPIRSGPEGIVVAAVTLAVPVITAMVMLGCYLHSSTVMSIQKRDIANYEAKVEELADVVALRESYQQEENDINNCLSEVSSSLGRHAQWSPVVAEVVGNMPDSVILTDLEVKHRLVRKKVPSENNPDQMVDVSVSVKTLQINVCVGLQADHSKVIRNFRNNLRFSPLLEPKLEDIRVSQKASRLDGRDVVSYEVSCDFKQQL